MAFSHGLNTDETRIVFARVQSVFHPWLKIACHLNSLPWTL